MSPKKRHIPIRTCVVCGAKAAKVDLVRIVASPDGVVIDTTGRTPGRGAYVCSGGRCLGPGLKRRRLESTLRATISDEEWEQLRESLIAPGVPE